MVSQTLAVTACLPCRSAQYIGSAARKRRGRTLRAARGRLCPSPRVEGQCQRGPRRTFSNRPWARSKEMGATPIVQFHETLASTRQRKSPPPLRSAGAAHPFPVRERRHVRCSIGRLFVRGPDQHSFRPPATSRRKQRPRARRGAPRKRKGQETKLFPPLSMASPQKEGIVRTRVRRFSSQGAS